ncbi:MAG: hypothetical protein EOM83_13325 [Clostridia bacterium]|nr:hypothetical protein [Clostridia bacterium]
MRNLTNTWVIDTHGKAPVGSLGFEKGFGVIGQQALFLRNKNSKTTRIFPVGIYYRIQQGLQNAVFPIWVETCFSKKELGKIINPLHDFG